MYALLSLTCRVMSSLISHCVILVNMFVYAKSIFGLTCTRINKAKVANMVCDKYIRGIRKINLPCRLIVAVKPVNIIE